MLLVVMLIVVLFYCYAESCYTECHYAECLYAECRSAYFVPKTVCKIRKELCKTDKHFTVVMNTVLVRLSDSRTNVVSDKKHFGLKAFRRIDAAPNIGYLS